MSRPDQTDDVDDLALALAAVARGQLTSREPGWEAVTHGRREADEVARERQDPATTELFRPFDADEDAALVDALLASVAASDDPATGAEAETELGADARDEAKPTGPDEVAHEGGSLRLIEGGADEQSSTSSRREAEPHPSSGSGGGAGRFAPLVALLSVAAALALWWAWPGAENPGLGEPPLIAALPSYGLETDGGRRVTRSAEPIKGGSYTLDTPFQWLLRPEVEVAQELGLRVFSQPSGDQAELTELTELTELAEAAKVEIAETGAVRISGTISSLGLDPGRWTITFVIGPPQGLPSGPPELAKIERAQTQGLVVRRLELTIQE